MDNIYEKINKIKQDFLKSNVKKSGKNSYSGFEYFELSDITPTLVELMSMYKINSYISFTNEIATLKLTNIENTKETIEITSPMATLELKGANAVQNLGGTITYMRRYLYLIAFDIVEPELFDKISGEIKEEKATINQLATIDKLMLDKKAICDFYKITSIQDLTKAQASQIIAKKTNNK